MTYELRNSNNELVATAKTEETARELANTLGAYYGYLRIVEVKQNYRESGNQVIRLARMERKLRNNRIMARNAKTNIASISHNTRVRLVASAKAQLDVLCKMDAEEAISFMNAQESRPIHKVNDLAESAVGVGSAFLDAAENTPSEIAGAIAEGQAQKYAFAMFRQILRDERLAKKLQ